MTMTSTTSKGFQLVHLNRFLLFSFVALLGSGRANQAEFWFETVAFDSPSPKWTLTRTREIHATDANGGKDANYWLVTGSKASVLIDTGMGFENLTQHLLEGGYLNRTLPLMVVATHEHFDHAAGMAAFDGIATLAAGAGDADAITESITERTLDDFVRDMAGSINDYWSASPPSITDFKAFVSEFTTQANIERSLTEGDTIELGDGATLTVLELPGHTPGSIGLYDSDSQAIFTGDTLYAGEIIDYVADSNTKDFDATMERLAELDVKVAYPGHYEILDGAQYKAVIDCYFDAWFYADCGHVLDAGTMLVPDIMTTIMATIVHTIIVLLATNRLLD